MRKRLKNNNLNAATVRVSKNRKQNLNLWPLVLIAIRERERWILNDISSSAVKMKRKYNILNVQSSFF